MARTGWTSLQAGPVRMWLVDGELRYLRVGQTEVLRRVYVAVRDRLWRTIPARAGNLRMKRGAREFQVTFDVAHTEGEIDFAWAGKITGEPSGRVVFEMDGRALSDFWRNRIGICVLHSDACAGMECVIEQPDGAREQGRFPDLIAPHQPFKNIRAITHEPSPGWQIEVRLEGDVFEMEDQRNWTDGSFKTYSTPLALPFPVEVKTGDRIAQSLTLTLRGAQLMDEDEAPQPVTITLGEAVGRLLQLGLGATARADEFGAMDLIRLRALQPAHLRVDLKLFGGDWRQRLTRGALEAAALNAKLELAVFVSDEAESELRVLRVALDALGSFGDVALARWLIFHQAEKVTAARWLALAQTILGGYDASVTFAAGTNNYFTEFNRNRPDEETLALADAVCYSFNPQVHATDEASLVEALAPQAATVYSARTFAGDKPICVSPVTLKPRFNPHQPDAPDDRTRLPASVDPRQATLFAAAWTIGSLKYLAESGAASATYFETVGWRGVLESAAGSERPDLFQSLPGMVFPIWHVLADVAEFAAAEVIATTSSDPLKVVCLALRGGDSTRLLLANVSGATQSVLLEAITGTARARRLNEANLVAAVTSPELFRQTSEALMVTNQLALALEVDEVVTIDLVHGSDGSGRI